MIPWADQGPQSGVAIVHHGFWHQGNLPMLRQASRNARGLRGMVQNAQCRMRFQLIALAADLLFLYLRQRFAINTLRCCRASFQSSNADFNAT